MYDQFLKRNPNFVLLLCAVMLLPSYADLNTILEVCEMFKGVAIATPSPSELPWPSRNVNLGLLAPSPTFYPLYHTGFQF